MVIQNKDARSGKYEPYVTAPRPSHGDYTYSREVRHAHWGGGGRSSARETVNWVAAGAVAEQVLDASEYDVEIKAHVNQIGDVEADDVSFEQILDHSEENDVRCADPEAAAEMQELIERYQEAGDSIGGSIYFECRGVPAGSAPRASTASRPGSGRRCSRSRRPRASSSDSARRRERDRERAQRGLDI